MASAGVNELFAGKRVLVTGGTGSLGRALTRRLLRGDQGRPSRIVVFSRDERKQQEMRLDLPRPRVAGEDLAYRDHLATVSYRLGDVRDLLAVAEALRGIDVVLHAAALKQVPTCEYEPFEAALTNIVGAHNIVRAIRLYDLPVQCVIGISTDKACEPVNVMGMTKAVQERVFTAANLHCGRTRLLCVRYGNVLGSRGSVVPHFLRQIAAGEAVTVTSPDMTRFMLTLDRAVDTVWRAYAEGEAGEVWVPILPSSRIADVARALIGERAVELRVVGIRPGEKIHETLIGEDETRRAVQRGDCYAIRPILPELTRAAPEPALRAAYSSREPVLDFAATRALLGSGGWLAPDALDRA
jgi:UDP-glucose 4-epimerase